MLIYNELKKFTELQKINNLNNKNNKKLNNKKF